MVLKLLGLGKKSEYFLEAPPATNGAEPKKADEPAPTPVKVEAPPKAEAADAQPVAAAENKAEAEPKVKKMKAVKSASPEAKSAPTPTVTAQPATKPAAVEMKNFATDGLMPMSMPRRRPGPSLDPFKDMARNVNPRK